MKFKDDINDLKEKKKKKAKEIILKQALNKYQIQRTYDNIGSSNKEEKRWL